MQKHLNIWVSGKVQGVFFRASTKEKADEVGIKGIVRNEGDGSVYIEAEGEENQLKTFTDWCKQGPSRASVTDCKIEQAELKHFTTFTITY
jgi:acylphosphatase